ncbi:Protein disulfide isomerase [Komagataella phaffii CBS 7435]|uniref:Protein disulfide-isomerase n=2 Tax=Komagataella TaxID=460517 RepID=B3VSN1_PICPA|nr:protein disulphide isomerase [Komagataella pastoris]AOA65124.1 GQ67_05237T0 [Komagataella phaffii]AOA70013.1 GQ68_05219T0 [Komagataella phaffii GS115]CAH2450476.1 Protein disulfide isomerase [Komagataella phaffii CBS 7435]CCA40283.1 Protein disulfide isomerase [Komagataella phaffii CBS 7435]
MQFNWNIKTVASILSALTLAQASDQEAIAPEDSHVVKLTEATFESFITSNPHVLAEFFAPWCGHCKKLGPELVSAAEILKDNEQVKIAQIDCTEEKELCQGYEIKGYPTLKVFHGEVEVPSDYQGQRQSQSIVSYMLKQSLPPVSEINATKDLDDTIAEAKEPVIVQVLPEDASNLESNTTFYGVAGTLREKFTFVSTKSTDYAKKYTSDSTPAYLLVRPGEEPSVYSGEELDETHLVHWIDIESKPLFGDIDGSTFKSYAEANIPLAYYFYENEEQRAAAADIIKPFAKEQRGKINFVGLDAVKFGKHAKNLNMDEEKLPLFVIHDLVSNKKFGVPQDQELTNKDVTELIEKFIAGEAEPIVKSEPIPEIQEEKVFKLVGKAHDEVVFDESKDVLVKYYAPWCGHCKRMAPAYEELATLYANDEDASSKVVIAKLDHTLNDVDNVDIQGYPTLILYPAGDKSNPQLYDGSRDLESLAEFVKERGTHKVDALALRPVEEEKEAEEEAESEADAHDEL